MSARILVIEDNAPNLELMTYLLESCGYTTLTARDGEAGLQTIEREKPDLVLCDIQLPKLNGFETIQRVRANPQLNDVVMIAVTALAMVGDRDQVLGAGFNGYLSKPITPETFVRQVESFLKPHQRSEVEAFKHQSELPPTGIKDAAQNHKRGTLLIIDNTASNLSFLQYTLESQGFSVVCAKTAAEGFAAAQRSVPDMIISDLHMPHEGGIDLLLKVKSTDDLKNIPFVLISSTVQSATEVKNGLALGAIDFILRPIDPKLLIDKVEACLLKGPPKGTT